MRVEFVKYDEKFLLLSKVWLSDPEIKRLTQTPDIDEEIQREWFKSLGVRNDYYIRGITADDIPIGACGLKHITSIEAEYWGYIGEKRYIGQGIGNVMLEGMINVARKLRIKELYLNVTTENERAIGLYLAKRFNCVGRCGDLIRMSRKIEV